MNDEDDNPFPRWLADRKMTVREAAVVLGASPSAVQAWKRKKPPRYIMQACMCISAGLPAWGEIAYSPPSKRR